MNIDVQTRTLEIKDASFKPHHILIRNDTSLEMEKLSMPNSNPRHRRAGFTLIEVLLVLVILVVISSISIGLYQGTARRANKEAAQSQINVLKTPMTTYHMHMKSYPQKLEHLWLDPTDGAQGSPWAGSYLTNPVPKDPWGNDYQYQFPGTHKPDSYDFWSYGPDGEESDDDISNWQ